MKTISRPGSKAAGFPRIADLAYLGDVAVRPAPATKPAVLPFRVKSTGPHEVVLWTEAKWHRLRPEDRPEQALLGHE